VLVGGRYLLHVVLKLLRQLGRRLAVAQHDDGPDHRSPLRVRGWDRRGLGDRRVADEGRLELGGPDPVPRRHDDVVAASLEPQGSVLVLAYVVAGRPPLAVDELRSAARVQVAVAARRTRGWLH